MATYCLSVLAPCSGRLSREPWGKLPTLKNRPVGVDHA